MMMMNGKRRFSDEQIRLLESIFEETTKLEPRRKLQLSKELGLQPRQVAIWFQNRRARWKSKQLEGEYSKLKASYDALASSFESLKKEKQCLQKQLQKLRDQVKNHPIETRRPEQSSDGNSDCANSDSGEAKPQSFVENIPELSMTMQTNSANSKSCEEGRGQEELTLVTMTEPADGSYFVSEWCDFDSGCFSDKSCSSLEWWELWPEKQPIGIFAAANQHDRCAGCRKMMENFKAYKIKRQGGIDRAMDKKI
ncbi:hypothetical protein ACLOJK_004907 [Asimina triloba]